MKENDICHQITEIIKPYVKNVEALTNINRDMRFIEDLKINSARLIDIIIDIEDKLNVTISDEEATKLRTLGDALNLVHQKSLLG